MPERNWTTERVRANFRIDAFSGVCAGVYLGVIVSFLPVVIRRMGGSTEDVALVVAGPFVGHLLSPVFGYLLARFRPVRITAFTSTLSRSIFLVGVLLAATPFALAFVSVLTWVIAVANMASYATLMQGIYPDSERASAMGKVRIGASIAGIRRLTISTNGLKLRDEIRKDWRSRGDELFARLRAHPARPTHGRAGPASSLPDRARRLER